MEYILLLTTVIFGGLRSVLTKLSTKDKSFFVKTKINSGIFLIGFVTILIVGIPFFNTIFEVPWALTVVYAISMVLAQVFLMLAFEFGSVSLSSLIYNCSFIIPTLFGSVYYNEKVGFIHIVGILLIVLSFGLSVKTEDRKCGIKWFLISITSCLFSGSLGCFQKMLKFEYPNVKVENFVQVSFFFMLIISLFIVLLIWFIKRKKHVEKEDEFDHNTFSLKKIQWKYLVFIVATGVIMGLMNSINVFLAGALPSVVVFPSVNGGGIVATTILSIIIFKEKITKKQKLALLFGFCGILAIGFGGLFV